MSLFYTRINDRRKVKNYRQIIKYNRLNSAYNRLLSAEIYTENGLVQGLKTRTEAVDSSVVSTTQ